MKVSRIKSSKRIFETQFGKDSIVLIKNASKYYPENDIEILEMTLPEYTEAITKQNEADLTPHAKTENLITAEKDKILRQLAIDSLKSKGKL